MTIQGSTTKPPGALIHWPLRYDLLVGFITLGQEKTFRERLVRLARLKPRESVLDVGCGTGSLAIAAWHRVRTEVHGVDASEEMIARARKKASKAGAAIQFHLGPAQALPFPDRHFDAVLMTVMLHHLARTARIEAILEARRVLRPGGRLFAVEFGAAGPKRGILAHLHRRHSYISADDTQALIRDGGLEAVESGEVGVGGLHFVLATVPAVP